MPRTMTPAMLAAIQANALYPALLVQMGFDSATAYMWTGFGALSWNGQTWYGLGRLLGIGVVEDGSTVEARGTSITLSGLDSSLLAGCLGDFQLGLPVIIYLALFGSTGVLLVDPISVWVGRTDQPTIQVDSDMTTITVACESRLLDMNVACDRRLTQEDQQSQWPRDLGLSFVAGVQEITLVWGLPLSSSNI